MGHLLNCPCPIQFQFCQIHFTASVFIICFPILFFFFLVTLIPVSNSIFFPTSFQFKEKLQELYVSFSQQVRFYEAITHSYQANAHFCHILVLQVVLY